MPPLPLGLSAYDRSELPPLSLVNMYYEKAPTNLQDQVALFPRPRLNQFATAGAGPITGLYRKGNVLANAGYSGQIICRSGDNLYRVHQTTGVAVLIDAVEGDQRMSAEGTEDVVVLCFGTKLYSTDGATLTEIAMPDSRFAYAVDYLNGYFIVTSEIGRFYWSALGGTTIDGLDYATAESQPDTLLTHKVIGDELWLFGRYSIEPWQPTGDLDLPFQRIGGRIFGIGVTGRETVQKLSQQGVDKVCWVGTDRRVYMTDPNPVPISDHALEERLSQVTDPADLYATTANDRHGHDFYVLHLTDSLGTWAFDIGTRKWTEWRSYGRDNFRGAVSTIAPNNAPLLGDDSSNVIWQLTHDERDDEGDPVVFEWSGLLEVAGPPTRCNNVLLELETGNNPDPDADPVVQLYLSDDNGRTEGDPLTAYLGRQGERATRVMWTRLGMLRRPGRRHRWVTTEPVTVRKAAYNESYR